MLWTVRFAAVPAPAFKGGGPLCLTGAAPQTPSRQSRLTLRDFSEEYLLSCCLFLFANVFYHLLQFVQTFKDLVVVVARHSINKYGIDKRETKYAPPAKKRTAKHSLTRRLSKPISPPVISTGISLHPSPVNSLKIVKRDAPGSPKSSGALLPKTVLQ